MNETDYQLRISMITYAYLVINFVCISYSIFLFWIFIALHMFAKDIYVL